MASALKRSIAFLLVLVLAIGMIPTAFAAEVEPTDSTTPDTHATDPPEETTSENTLPVSQTEPETISLLEDEMDYLALDNSIAVFAEAEISGAPNAFANLTLPNGGIDIPAQGYIQHKKILPLYSVYLKNQTGYANNYYVAYCIEPGVELGNTGHSGTAYTLDGMTEGSGAMYRLSREKVEAIGVALMYGQRDIASKKDEQSLRYEKLCRHAATQAIIWEIACGWRSPYPPYTLWDSTLYDAITPSLYCASSVWGTTFYLDGMDDAYRVIANQMIYLKDYASFISDKFVTKLTDQSRSMMLSIDIVPVATDEAVREVERKMLGVETNITNWQRRQNANNNFSAMVPYDMELQRKETKEYMDDLTGRDQRMMLAVLTLIHLADTKEQLDADTDALLKVGADHVCQMAVLRYQQLDGMNTALPIGTRKIDTFRTLTTESLAAFMPFKVQEIQEPGGIYIGENAVSHNLILCNMNNLLNQSMMLLGMWT